MIVETVLFTYIVETKKGEYYCGKTTDINRRLEEHHKGINGVWFSFNNRNDFKLVFLMGGDYEKKIKSFGVKLFYNISNRRSPLSCLIV